VLVSSVAFGLAHSYQGLGGIMRTGLVGLAFGALFVFSGSIWLPIVGHILVDVLQGRQLREIYRDVNEPAAA
jgi:membrane protease YdiL (CAAX protease family)